MNAEPQSKPTLDFSQVHYLSYGRRSLRSPYRWFRVYHKQTGEDLLGYRIESSWDSKHIPQLVHDALDALYTLTNVPKRLRPNPPTVPDKETNDVDA